MYLVIRISINENFVRILAFFLLVSDEMGVWSTSCRYALFVKLLVWITELLVILKIGYLPMTET